MNYIFISPHFPYIFENFAVHLKEKGVNVLGIADEAYDKLRPRLKSGLTEYYKVNNLENYEEVLRACGYFTHKYGKIDRVESHNEYWLSLDAHIRTDFNVFGYKNADMPRIQQKSGMKEVFRSCGIPVAKGRVFSDYDDALGLAEELNYPVCIKPNAGVGASDTYKIRNKEELDHFFSIRVPHIEYIMEEFIDGAIVTYDGLTDKEGNIVFDCCLKYDRPVIEIAHFNSDMYYYVPREIEEDLKEYGRLCVEAFDIRERFFHIEFFRKSDDQSLMALELNCRLPGGNTPEMWNYANDFDIYQEYANVVVDQKFNASIERPYFCCYVSRKSFRNYTYSQEEIQNRYGDKIMSIESIPGIFSQIMGDVGFILRTPDRDEMDHIISEIWQEN